MRLHALEVPSRKPQSLAFSPDAGRIAAGFDRGEGYEWDVVTGDLITSFTTGSHPVTSVAFSPDQSRILTAQGTEKALIWNAATGAQEGFLTQDPADQLVVASYSPDGSQAAAGATDGDLLVWNVTSGTVTLRQPVQAAYSIRIVLFSPGGHSVLVGGYDSVVREINTTTGEVIRSFPIPMPALSAAFSQDSALLAVGIIDGRTIVFDYVHGTEFRAFNGQLDYVVGVGFVQRSRALLSASTDLTVFAWPAHVSLAILETLLGRFLPETIFDVDGNGEVGMSDFIESIRIAPTGGAMRQEAPDSN